ncbi:hypothetical protein NP493_189g03017 [Ridgeia piscesae]|uniref:Uncharacterized protein n=1 Tax=Ridgeia piscesae TaxID=27915 RepID=A0AAD9P270_RIDPI|nr:hypothetical protein NP493_189g03017 [Ridgeia piscesae]
MIAGDHDDLDASTAAFSHGIRHGGSWGVNHGHEAHKSETREREVLSVRVEGVARGELIHRQVEVAETCTRFSEPPEVEVGLVEGVTPLLGHFLVLAIDHDGGAAVKDALRSTLHHQQVLRARRTAELMHRHLIFVGRVEWDLTDFLVLSTELSDVANGQLNTLEQSRL